MLPVERRIRRTLLGLVAGGCILSTALHAQSEKNPAPSPPSGDSEQVLRLLLAEVHQLRLAIQQSALLNTRFQLAIERMRLQQAHVLAINRELSDLRQTVSSRETELGNLVERRKGLEDELAQVVGAERAGLEASLRILRATMAALEHEIQEARVREAELSGSLQTEQIRLDAADRALQDLSKELEDR